MGIVVSATCTPTLGRKSTEIQRTHRLVGILCNLILKLRHRSKNQQRRRPISTGGRALCGVTPNYGLHIDENRKPEVRVDVKAKLDDNADFGALGYLVGKQVKNRIPYFTGIKDADTDQLKALGASDGSIRGGGTLPHRRHDP